MNANPFVTTPVLAPAEPERAEMFPNAEERRGLQTKFAVALLRNPDDAFKAGLEVFGADTGRALWAANNWIHDEFVESERVRLIKSHGARSFLPSKEDYAREVWRTATDPKTPSDDRKYLLSLYGDIMGFKQQAEKSGINVNVMQQSVMVVPTHGSDADWEKAAVAQQAALARRNQNQTATDVSSRTIN